MSRKLIGKVLVCPVFLSVALVGETVSARNLDNGGFAVVGPGDLIEDWSVTNGSTLNVGLGGETGYINIRDSTLNIDGGKTSSSTNIGINLQSGSVGSIRSATVISTVDTGVLLASSFGGPITQATITNSDISGVSRGVSVSNSDVVISGTNVVGNDDGRTGFLYGGMGLGLFAGRAIVTSGSTITGAMNGVLISPDSGGGAAGRFSNLTVDGSTIVGLNGSAIIVGSYTSNRTADATIVIQNGSTLTGGNGVILEVANNSNADFTVDNSNLIGDVVVEAGSNAEVTLRNNASITGQLTNVSKLNLNTNAVWNMVADASVDNITLAGGGIKLGDGTTFRTLNIGTLTGDGTFFMNTNLAAGLGDFLNITGVASGNHQLGITNTGLEPALNDNRLQVVHTGGGSAQFGVIGGKVDAGAYEYELVKEGDNWYLVQAKDGGGGPITSPSTQTLLGLFNTAPSIWYGEQSSLRSRLGDLRLGQENGGLWTRTYGREYNVNSRAGQSYNQNQNGFSLGADAPISIEGGQLLVGILVGHSRSGLDFGKGSSGKVDSYYLGGYMTWLSDNGYYLDGLLKANRFVNDAKVRMSDGQKADGDYKNYGLGTSLEFGRHVDLNNGWYVEPSAQLSIVWIEGQSAKLSNGMEADASHNASYQAKIGSVIGRNIIMRGSVLQPYLKAALVQEFAKDNTVHVNGIGFNNDLSGSRAELGVGIAAQLSEKLQLHTDFDYSKGSKIEQPWGMNVGLRYAF